MLLLAFASRLEHGAQVPLGLGRDRWIGSKAVFADSLEPRGGAPSANSRLVRDISAFGTRGSIPHPYHRLRRTTSLTMCNIPTEQGEWYIQGPPQYRKLCSSKKPDIHLVLQKWLSQTTLKIAASWPFLVGQCAPPTSDDDVSYSRVLISAVIVPNHPKVGSIEAASFRSCIGALLPRWPTRVVRIYTVRSPAGYNVMLLRAGGSAVLCAGVIFPGQWGTQDRPQSHLQSMRYLGRLGRGTLRMF